MIFNPPNPNGNSLMMLLGKAIDLYKTEAIFTFLDDKSAAVRLASAMALQSKFEPIVFDMAVKYILSKRSQDRELGVFILSQLDYRNNYRFAKQSLPHLLVALKNDRVASVRQRAAIGLGRLRLNEAIPELVEASYDESSYVRYGIADALFFLEKNDLSKECLFRFSYDEDPDVRAMSLMALEEFEKTDDVVECIERLFKDPNEIVQDMVDFVMSYREEEQNNNGK